MKIILCLENSGGMIFNNRRLSKDIKVTEDILQTVKSNRLFINDFSKDLFCMPNGGLYKNIYLTEDFFNLQKEDYCFLENTDVLKFLNKADTFIIYNWNRDYPYDFNFNKDYLTGFKLLSTKEFKGNSHEKITKDVYVK